MTAQLLEYGERAPDGAAAQVARAIWSLRGSVGDGAANAVAEPIVPDGRAEIVFNFGDPFEEVGAQGPSRQPSLMVVGPSSRPRFVRPTGRVDVIGVRVQSWAVPALGGVPAFELRDQVIRLDSLGRHLGELGRRLGDAPPGARPSILGAWLSTVATSDADSSNETRLLLEAIRAADRPLTVAGLARHAGRSVRAVQRAFARDVGVGPRTIVRLAQVQRALRLARSAPARTWAWIAARSGYFDHSHLVRDFRELVGVLPSELRREMPELTAAFLES